MIRERRQRHHRSGDQAGFCRRGNGSVVGEKRIVSGEDSCSAGLLKAYAGSLKDFSAVGLVKDTTFLEVRVTDPMLEDDVAAKLQTVMKAVAARLP